MSTPKIGMDYKEMQQWLLTQSCASGDPQEFIKTLYVVINDIHEAWLYWQPYLQRMNCPDPSQYVDKG